MDNTLTDAEIVQIGGKMLHHGGNVYVVSEASFGKEFRDPEDWDRLKKAGISKCELCDRWHSFHPRLHRYPDICAECGGRD